MYVCMYVLGPKTIFFWAPTFKWVSHKNRLIITYNYYYDRVWSLLVWPILKDLVRN